MVKVPREKEPMITYDAVAAVINHGIIHYMLGMRGYYFAVPLASRLFGPTWMLTGTITMAAIFYGTGRTV
jgi:hypothetical protein